ncbi:hypothetical protein TREPR_1662 [Treponema primitia ZAS-2]|uniref:Uncharacterized protein n=1 Tax=Treponema primitia (strain ATCC BAA-887 / DSM 12427 / ZAS-2) TaxID=545694 RepID=F5YNN2_TREPZ|nr:hypothetical protein TREPR_1662 [Treponema primitia ZAS-2]
MAETVDWRDTLYTKTFEQELRGLLRRREADPSCTIGDIEGTLKHLYVMDGADWLGRGEVGDITMAATIAAYEHMVSEWKAEKKSVKKCYPSGVPFVSELGKRLALFPIPPFLFICPGESFSPGLFF